LSAIPLRDNRASEWGPESVQKALAAAFDSAGLDEAAAPALAEALHCLRVAVTLLDSNERLIFSNQHYNYLFRSLPARERLVGLTYEQLVRLEVRGGEIAPHHARDVDAFVG